MIIPGLLEVPNVEPRPIAGGLAAGKMALMFVGAVCRDIRGTGGPVGGLGIDACAGARAGVATCGVTT